MVRVQPFINEKGNEESPQAEARGGIAWMRRPEAPDSPSMMIVWSGVQSSGRRSGLSSDSELLDSEDGEIDWEREPIRRKKKDGMRIVRLIIGFPHHQKGDAVSIANYLTGWRAPQLKDEEWIPFGKEDRNLSRHHLFSRLLGQTMWLLRHLLLSWGSFRTSALVDSLLSTKLRFFYLMNE